LRLKINFHLILNRARNLKNELTLLILEWAFLFLGRLNLSIYRGVKFVCCSFGWGALFILEWA
jgi:hypothetical protein